MYRDNMNINVQLGKINGNGDTHDQAAYSGAKSRAMKVERKPDVQTVGEVIDQLKTWRTIHDPYDRGGRLNLFQFVKLSDQPVNAPVRFANALVPFTEGEKQVEPIVLNETAMNQLLGRLDFSTRTYEELSPKLALLCVNDLIQNKKGDKEITLRIIDKCRARALVSGRYESYDALIDDPDGKTLYGLANSITRAAESFNGETSFDMERLGAKVMAGNI